MSTYKKQSSHESTWYNSIRTSTVSWRKKSSYKKKLKREISKKIRREGKKELKEY
jgi:hypothetical protein